MPDDGQNIRISPENKPKLPQTFQLNARPRPLILKNQSIIPIINVIQHP